MKANGPVTFLFRTVRALQGDVVPRHQQHSLQSASIVMFSLGDLAASGLVHAIEEPVSYIRYCFLAAGLMYFLTVASLLFLAKERPIQPNELSVEESQGQAMNIFSYLHALPPWMWRVGGTHALGFFSLFCFLPNTSTWLGTTVLGGTSGLRRCTCSDFRFEARRLTNSVTLVRCVQMLAVLTLKEIQVRSQDQKGLRSTREE